MVLRVFKVVWFVSMLALFAALLYSYAGWGEELIVQEDELQNVTIGKEPFFYLLLTIFGLTNVLVYVMARFFQSRHAFRTWFHGLIVTINVFFIIALSLIGLHNSFEDYDYTRLAFFAYGSIALILLWACTWPIYLLIQKISLKDPVR